MFLRLTGPISPGNSWGYCRAMMDERQMRFSGCLKRDVCENVPVRSPGRRWYPVASSTADSGRPITPCDPDSVAPVKAGVQEPLEASWIPAYAGMTTPVGSSGGGRVGIPTPECFRRPHVRREEEGGFSLDGRAAAMYGIYATIPVGDNGPAQASVVDPDMRNKANLPRFWPKNGGRAENKANSPGLVGGEGMR